MIVYVLKLALNTLLIVHLRSMFGPSYGHKVEGGGKGCGSEGGGCGAILGIVI